MILSIDSATRWAGLALHDGRFIVAESGWQCNNNHTIALTPAIGEMLARADITPADLDAIAIAKGPGSYTGLRVGMALAKGMAYANRTALIGVPTLDIVAAGFGPMQGQLVAVASAGRTRICTAVYQWKKRYGWQSDQTPIIETWDELLGRLDAPSTIAGEITVEAAKKIRAHEGSFKIASPAASMRRAGHLAEIGWRRLRRGQTDDPASLAPIYLNRLT